MTSSTDGLCKASLQLPQLWFTSNVSNASVSIDIRLLSSTNLPLPIGSVRLYQHTLPAIVNNVVVILPARPIGPGEAFTAQAIAHATYAVATFSVTCSVNDQLQVQSVMVDQSKWTAQVRVKNSSEFGIVAILRDPGSASFNPSPSEEIFSFSLISSPDADNSLNGHVSCMVVYLSNVLNEQVFPGGIEPPAPALVVDAVADADAVHFSDIETVALLSYAGQAQVVNTAVFTQSTIQVPLHHFIVQSNEQLIVPEQVNCSTTSSAFSLSKVCDAVLLTGAEVEGTSGGIITVTYEDFSTSIRIRVWYPHAGGFLTSSVPIIRPVQGWLMENSSGQCTQQFQPAQVFAFANFTYSQTSPSFVGSILDLIAGSLSSSHPSVVTVSSSGLLTAHGVGTSTITAGPRIQQTIVSVTMNNPVRVESLGVTLFSGISVSLPNSSVSILSTVEAVAMLEQNFTSITSPVFLAATALLSDGETIPVASKDGLQIQSLNEDVITIAGGSLQLTGKGEGELVHARWMPNCTSEALAEGRGIALTTIPDPTELLVDVSSLKLTPSSNMATAAGVPSQAVVEIFLLYPNGENRSITMDPAVNISQSPLDEPLLLFSYNSSRLVLSVDSQVAAPGVTVLFINYNNGQLNKSVEINVVTYMSLRLTSSPYPTYEGSNTLQVTTLYRIAPTSRFQQSALQLFVQLSDNSSISVTNSPLSSLTHTSGPVSLFGNVVTPAQPGEAIFMGTLGGVADIATLSLTISSQPVTIQAFQNLSVGTNLLSGLANQATTQVMAHALFNDSTVYPNFIPDATAQLPGVVSFTSSVSDAAAVDSSGRITLLGNHHQAVEISVTATGGTSASISITCNLLPGVGDVDIGGSNGVPIPSVHEGESFQLPITINVGGTSFHSVSLSLQYNPSLLQLTSVSAATGWSSGVQTSGDTQLGLVTISSSQSSPDITGLVTFSVIAFTASSAGSASIQGIIGTLQDTSLNTIGSPTPKPIVAGDVTVDILSSKRKRRSVATTACSVSQEIGDTDGNCIFNSSDTDFLLSYLVEGLFNFSLPSGMSISSNLTAGQIRQLDADRNSRVDPSDAYYLHRASNGLINFLTNLSASPVDVRMGCVLTLNASLLSRGNEFPEPNLTALFFDVSLPFTSLSQQLVFTGSQILQGKLVLTSKGSLLLQGGIVQAELLGDGIYSAVIATNLTAANIGLSVIQITSADGLTTGPGRVQAMFGYSGLSPAYPHRLDITLEAFTQSIPILATRGYTPYTYFDNSLSSSTCTSSSVPQFSQPLYSIAVPENTPVGRVVLTIIVTNINVEGLTFRLTGGNTGNAFTIIPNGSLSVNTSLDFETISSYQLTVTAMELDTRQLNTTTVQVDILDVNDNRPVITVTSNISIPLNLPNGSVVLSVNASDADSGLNGELRYYIDEDPMMLFAIDELLGLITISQQPNSSNSNYQLVLSVRDLGKPPLTSTAVVNITFTANVTTVLQFEMTVYSTNVSEGALIDSVVGEVQAQFSGVNVELDLVVTYSLISPADSPFSVDSATGVITLTSSIDRETIASYQLQIRADATDTFPALTVVLVEVTDINDNAPLFSSPAYSTTLVENSPPTELSVTITATDADIGSNAAISYSLIGNTTSIEINSSSGALRTLVPLDHETTPELFVTVLATDNGVPPQNSTVGVAITITDLNDNPPIITSSENTPTLAEDTPLGSVVVNLSTSDSDSPAVNGPTIIQFTSGDPHFNLSGSGNAIVLSAPLDYEVQDNFSLILEASDSTDSELASVLTLTVLVTDINDNPPMFAQSEYEISVNESLPVGELIIFLVVTDDDEGVNAEITLAIVSGNKNGTFSLLNSGELLLNRSLNFEAVSLYHLEVRASNIVPGTTSAHTNVTIVVTDVNEFPPQFSQSVYEASVTEGPSSLGHIVVTVTAMDRDTAETISFNLTNSFNIFNIHTNGTVFTLAELDREQRDQYMLLVAAYDSGTPRMSSSAEVRVTVLDINDNSPVFSRVNNVSISEGASIGDVVAFINATDADIGSNGFVSLSLKDDFSTWNLSSEGLLSVAEPLNATEVPTYIITVVAEDQGTPPRSSSAELMVTVQLLLPETPVFEQLVYTASITENSTDGFILSVNASSTEPTLSIVYSLSTLSELLYGSLFDINSSSGDLTALQPLDREQQDFYQLSVVATATLKGRESSNTALVNITVLDVNDNAPQFLTPPQTLVLLENTTVGYHVITLEASDDDLGDNAVILYSISGGNGSSLGVFSVDRITGTINITAPLPHGPTVYSLVVTAANPSNITPLLSSTIHLIIVVEPVNPSAPMFSEDFYAISFPENVSVGSLLLIVAASDGSGDEADMISYLLRGGEGVVDIDPKTGEVMLTASLDYENITRYVFTVTAVDNGQPPRSATINVTLTVQDINDNPPVFSAGNYTATVVEGSPANKTVTAVSVSDADSPLNSEAIFSITNGATDMFFIIPTGAQTASIASYTSLDREEAEEYHLTVQALNSGGGVTLTATTSIIILVEDINDNAPLFNQSDYREVVPLPVLSNETVASVQATDPDHAINGTFRFSLQSTSTPFLIDPLTGALTSTQELLQSTNYSLTVVATDFGVPPLSTSAEISIILKYPSEADLAIGREEDITVSAEDGLQLIGLPSAVTPTSFLQQYSLVVGRSSREVRTVTAQLQELSNSLSVQPALSPAVSVDAFLLTPEVWHDVPVVRVAAQVKSGRQNVHTTPTMIQCIATHSTLGNRSAQCSPNSNGTCIISINLPQEWFSTDATLPVSCGLSKVNTRHVGDVLLNQRLLFNSTSTMYIFMELPFTSLFRGELFSFPVFAEAGINPVGSYTVSIRCSADFELVNLTVDTAVWLATQNTVEAGREIFITASQTGSALPPGRSQLLEIHARVRETATQGHLHGSAFNLTIYFLGDTERAMLLPKGSPSQPGFTLSRTGVGLTGAVYVDSNRPQGIFLHTPNNELLNTALLTGTNTLLPLAVLVGVQNGGLLMVASGATCFSHNLTIIDVAENCSFLQLTPSQHQSATGGIVQASYMGVVGILVVRVWVPQAASPLLLVSDNVLNRIPKWMEERNGSCLQQFQRAYVHVLVNFTDSESVVMNVRVTELVQHRIRSSEPSVVSVQGNLLTGLNPGTASVQLLSADNLNVLEEVAVEVTSDSVNIVGLDVQVLTDIHLAYTPFPDPTSTHNLTMRTEQLFDFEGDTGYVVVAAVFADDTRLLLSSSPGLTLATLPPVNFISLTDNRITPLTSGEGEVIQAVWRSSSVCGQQLISSGVGRVSVSLPQPMNITVRLTSPLSAPGSTAARIGVPSLTAIEVVAVFANETADLTSDDRTNYAFSTDQFSLAANILRVNSQAASGIHNITITFNQYPALQRIVQVEIVDVTDLSLTANPYPTYPGSSSTQVMSLHPIAMTGVLQKAIISVAAALSSGASQDVSSDPDVAINVSSTPLQLSAIINNMRVLSVTLMNVSGTVELCATVGDVTCSSPLTITISTQQVSVSDISIHDFPANTFRGLVGTIHQTLLSVTFNDSTQYLSLVAEQLPNLVNFQASPDAAFSIVSHTGVATLLGNSFPNAELTVTAIGSSVQRTLQFHCNLDPAVGDVDVGSPTGPPIDSKSVGSDFTVPVRVNSGEFVLDSIQLVIEFDPSLLQALSATPGPSWTPASSFAYGDQSSTNVITLGGSLVSSGLSPVRGTSLHLADITFRSLSSGTAYVNGSITTFAHQAESAVAPNIGTVPRSIIAGSVQLAVTMQKRSVPAEVPQLSYSARQRRQSCEDGSVCAVCSPEREVGDLDGNCLFDVRDISFLQTYYLRQVATGIADPLPPDRVAFLDPDLSGSTDPNDVIFLLRAAFQLYHFITSTQITPISEDTCKLVINVTMVQRGNVSPDPQFTALLVDFAHQDSHFQQQFAATNFTSGSVLTANKGPGQYGGVVQMDYSGDRFILQANAAFNATNIGISLIQVTFDVFGKTSSMRVASMFSQGPALYPSLDLSLTVMEQPISVQAQAGYAPLYLMNNTLTSEQCLALMQPISFEQQGYSATVPENAAIDTLVIKVLAVASHPDAVITYTLLSNVSLPFFVNSTSGNVTVAGPIDFEMIPAYQFVVEGTESRRMTSATASITIFVTNLNDLPPLLQPVDNVTIPANVSEGTVVLKVSASDPDSLDSIVYSVSNQSPPGFVSINSTTGVVSVTMSLLPVGNEVIELVLAASDSSFTSTTPVSISTFLPSFSQPSYTALVQEDAQVGQVVAMVTLLNTETENFTLCVQPSRPFTINSLGVIRVNESLDYETQQAFNLSIVATSEHFVIETSLDIAIMDVNDNPPIFSMSSYSQHLLSSTPLGTSISLVEASDADSTPNSIITFSLAPSSESQFIAIENTTGSLLIIRSLLSAPSVVDLTVVASDGVSNSSALVELVLEAAVAPSFPGPPELSSTGGAFLLGGLSDEGEGVLTQQFGSVASTNSTITAHTRSSIETQERVNLTLQQAETVLAALLHPSNDVYKDHRVLQFAAQVRDVNHLTATLPTLLSIYAQRGMDIAMSNCIPDGVYGLCNTSLEIPLNWFSEEDAEVSWFTQLPMKTPVLSPTVLVLKGFKDPVVTHQIVIETPAGPVLPGDMVNLTASGFTQFAVTSFTLLFDLHPDLVVSGVFFNGSIWTINSVQDGSQLGVLGVVSTPRDTLTPSPELFTVQVQVPHSTSEKNFTISAQVHSLSDAVEGPINLNASEKRREGPALFVSRGSNALSTEGRILVAVNRITSLFPYTSQPELLNMAALSSTPLYHPVELWAGYSSGRIAQYGGAVNCSSSDPQVVNISQDCFSTVLSGREQNGSDLVSVHFSVDGVTASLPLRVYFPDISSVELRLSDSSLEVVQYSLVGRCNTSYQQASIHAYSDFITPSLTLSTIIISEHIKAFLVSVNASVVAVDTNQRLVNAREEGSTQICISMTSNETIVCTDVSVSGSLVHVAALRVAAVSSLSLFLPPTPLLLPQTLTLEVSSQLTEEGILLAAIQFTDNTSVSLDPSDLQLQALTPVLTVSPTGTITAVSSGEGRVMVTWTAPGPACPVEVVQVVDITVSLPQPVDIVTSPPSDSISSLTLPSDPAASVGVKSVYNLRVQLVFADNTTADVTQAQTTTYTNSSNLISLLVTEEGIRVTAGNAGTGLAHVEVSISQYNTSATISFRVVALQSLMLSFTPFPSLLNHTISTVARIEGTTIWQKAEVHLVATLTDGTSYEITDSPSVSYDISTVSTISANLSSSNVVIITPLSGNSSSGVVMVTGRLAPSAAITQHLTAVGTPVSVSGVVVSPLPNNTLVGIASSPSHQLNVTLLLSDNTHYPDVFSSLEPELKALVSVQSSDTSSFIVLADGYLQPMANTPAAVSVHVAASSQSQELSFFVNLLPAVGDIDLGQAFGPALPPVDTGEVFLVPVLINTGREHIGAVRVVLDYNPLVLSVDAVLVGSDWPEGMHYEKADQSTGEVSFTGVQVRPGVGGEKVHLFSVRFAVTTAAEQTQLTGRVTTLRSLSVASETIGEQKPRDSTAANISLTIRGIGKRDAEVSPVSLRVRRQASNCSSPPCSCEKAVAGDTNGDCVFDSSDVLHSLTYVSQQLLNFSLPDGQAILNLTSPVQLAQLDPTMDSDITADDCYFLFRAAVGLTQFLTGVEVTPVQSLLSSCLLSIAVTTSAPMGRAVVYVDIALPGSSLQDEFDSSDVVTGALITSNKGEGLFGGLLQANEEGDGQFRVSLNASFASSEIGISFVLQTLNNANQTSLSRSVQLFGSPPVRYSSPLHINSSSLLVSASTGYSPLLITTSNLTTLDCSDLPLIAPQINVTFLSPYQVHLSWQLLNQRSGLNFSGFITISVTRCSMSQSGLILEETCTNYTLMADSDTSSLLPTSPFTAYTFQVISAASQSMVVTATSPEAGQYHEISCTVFVH